MAESKSNKEPENYLKVLVRRELNADSIVPVSNEQVETAYVNIKKELEAERDLKEQIIDLQADAVYWANRAISS